MGGSSSFENCAFYIKYWPHVWEFKTVLDSGFYGFQELDFGFFVCGTRIPDSNLS